MEYFVDGDQKWPDRSKSLKSGTIGQKGSKLSVWIILEKPKIAQTDVKIGCNRKRLHISKNNGSQLKNPDISGAL